jgi:hypothetical protein
MEIIVKIAQTVYQRARWSAFWSTYRLPTVNLQEVAPDTELVAPAITELLCLPPYFEGTTDHDDASPLFTLIRHFAPKVVLELGTAQGATVANICAISDARVYTVNALPEQMEGDIVTFTLTKEEIGSIYRKHGYSERVTQIYENTWKLDLLRYIPPNSVDFAIIDACHDVDFVINDFHCVLPVLHDRSVVLFHDVHPSMRDHLLDSYVACMCLRREGFNIQHLDGTWWGIWQATNASSAPSWLARSISRIDQTFVQLRGKRLAADPKALRWLAYKYHR